MSRMKMKPKEPIPDFKTIEEEREFWHTHDFIDYLDEFKPVKLKFSKKALSKEVMVHIDPTTLAELKKRAKARGIPSLDDFIFVWILERLEQEKKAESQTEKAEARTG